MPDYEYIHQEMQKSGVTLSLLWIRHVLVPGITDDEGQLMRLRAFIDTLDTVERVEVLPYHTLGVFKWKELGIPYALEDVDPPSQESVARAKEILGCQV